MPRPGDFLIKVYDDYYGWVGSDTDDVVYRHDEANARFDHLRLHVPFIVKSATEGVQEQSVVKIRAIFLGASALDRLVTSGIPVTYPDEVALNTEIAYEADLLNRLEPEGDLYNEDDEDDTID